MAIDTAVKRASVVHMIIPDGTLGQNDWQTIARMYGGILAAAAVAVVIAAGKLSVVITVYQPSVTIAATQPGVTITATQPSVTVT